MHELHYDRLAGAYERFWANRPDYVTWMNDHIMEWLAPEPGYRMADVGVGTGLFLSRLKEAASASTPILCIDPSQGMLDRLPADPRLYPVLGTAESVASGEISLPYDQVDAIVFKESIHHVHDIPTTMKGLAGLLATGGSILVVTLPPRLEYPLFSAALDRFAAGQPDPDDIEKAMRGAGLDVTAASERFAVTIDRDHWLSLVADRAMSVLSTFTDEELDEGLEEIRYRFPHRTLRYTDRFSFIKGTKVRAVA